jgi:hypothetical protein
LKEGIMVRRLSRLLAVALGASMLFISVSAVANGGNTISGTVSLDGVPLAGVEVFIGPDVHTCTDSNGRYEVTVASTEFIASGPQVDASSGCSNPRFVDSDGTPLMVAKAPGPAVAPAVVNLLVERLPSDTPGFYQKLRSALNNCYDGDGASTADLLNGFDEKVDRALNKDKPKLSQDAADNYMAYAEDLRFISGAVCPTS